MMTCTKPSLCELLLLFVVVILSLATTLTNADVPRPRGVPVEKAALYSPRPDLSWVCLDGRRTIRAEQINDDYCDCADGSDEPGTSACSQSSFHCVNIGHKPLNVPSSRVNDGVCDCCDGSDEYDAQVRCENTCFRQGLAELEQRKSRAELHKKGAAKRSELIAKGKQLKVERDWRRAELERRRNEQETLKAEKEQLKKVAEAAESDALELYKGQQQQQEQNEEGANHEAGDSAGGPELMRAEARASFVFYDKNKDGFVEMTELQVDMRLDRNRDGVVTIEEAKYFLDERERVDIDAFVALSWPRIKPIQMLADGLFKPPVEETEEAELLQDPEKAPQQPNIEGTESTHPISDHTTDDGHHEEDDDEDGENFEEEDINGDEDLDADVGVGSVEPEVTTAAPEYDPETQRLIELANEARRAHTEVENDIRDIEHEIKEIDDHDAKDYGPNEEYAAMDGECFAYEDREYVYTLCPFDRAAQKQRSGGAETTLGRWDQWLHDDNGGHKYGKQKYAHGASCWNGPQRSAVVQLKCALESRIISVAEPNRCEYFFEFETPAACDSPNDTSDDVHDEL